MTTSALHFVDRRVDPWQAHVEGEQPAAYRWMRIAQWDDLRAFWPADAPLGLAVANDEDVEPLAGELHRFGLLALEFPKWADGRAYSQARLLRVRLRFRGELRATGEVLADMAPLLLRCGFDSAVLRADQREAVARRALGGFVDGHYQGDAIEPRPHWARAGEAAAA